MTYSQDSHPPKRKLEQHRVTDKNAHLRLKERLCVRCSKEKILSRWPDRCETCKRVTSRMADVEPVTVHRPDR